MAVLTHDNDNGEHDANDNACCLSSSRTTSIRINWHLVGGNSWNWRLCGRLRWRQSLGSTALSFCWPTTLKLFSIVFSAATTLECVILTLAAFRYAVRVATRPIGLLVFARGRGAVKTTRLIGATCACICAKSLVNTTTARSFIYLASL